MSKMKEARDCLAVARDVRKTKKVRYEALLMADEARKDAKLSWKRIEPGFDPAVLRQEIKEYRRGAEGPRGPKEGVCKLIRELLMEPSLGYSDIRVKALEQFPENHPTTKSIASLARDMKRKGIPVPPRKGKVFHETSHQHEEETEHVEADEDSTVEDGFFWGSPHGDPSESYNHA